MSEKTSVFGEKLGNGLKKAAEIGAKALTAATTAVTAFAAESVKTGMEFDSSMSQVAATMGVTTDEIEELREFALEMGSATAFSASQAADALNYMALAGYDSAEAMEALPNVLNLAAAGGIELAAASDMVTDAQSALGLSMDEAAELVDKMAKASSKSNTSVAQLGEAILSIGGTAQNLAGGTTELSTALGILADNGIKGAEGGTHLRNVILSLAAPTDAAADALIQFGGAAQLVYDENGNMRSLNDIFSDLNDIMADMQQNERTELLNTMFNKTDLSAVNALLANTGERFDELSGYIDNAAGAAEEMANTQLDNLAGDITLFQSALEGAQIAISDELTPSLREFVQFGSKSVGELTTAFQEGGFAGAMSALGGIISDGIGMITEMLPQMVEAGAALLGSLASGIAEQLPTLAESAVEIVTSLASDLSAQLPEMIPAAIDLLLGLVDGLLDNLPMLVEAAINLMVGFAEGLVNAIPSIVEKVPDIIVSIIEALVGAIPQLAEAALEMFTDIGKNIVDGIKAGISNAWESLKEWFSNLWDNLVGGVKDLLGIHSPSTVFAGIGKNMALGVGEGWEDEFGSIRSDIEDSIDFGTASVDFASSSLGQQSGAIANSVMSAAAQGESRDIVINLTATLDGTKLAQTSYRYNQNEAMRRGRDLVVA